MGLEAVVEEIREKGKKKQKRYVQSQSRIQTKSLQQPENVPVDIKLLRRQNLQSRLPILLIRKPLQQTCLSNVELLNTQKALLDKVYETTLLEIARLPESFHREAIKKLLTEAKKEITKGKIYCNTRDTVAVKAIISENS